MFLIDDLILAVIVACVVLLVLVFSSAMACFLGLLVGCYNIKPNQVTIGGVLGDEQKKPPESRLTEEKEIPLKELTNRNMMYSPNYVGEYDSKPFDEEKKKRMMAYLEKAKKICKDAGLDSSLFELGEESFMEYTPKPQTINTAQIIGDLYKKRVLDDKYTETDKHYSNTNGIKDMEFSQNDPNKFKVMLDRVHDLSIIQSLKDLTQEELKEVEQYTNDFNSKQLTGPNIKVNYYNGRSKYITTCKIDKNDITETKTYKRLHWGQRKLLLSEIDFFNRVSEKIGYDTFKTQNICLVYPGSASGHHLLTEMLMYPNLFLFLWDPAIFYDILLIADFIRRGLSLEGYGWTQNQITEARKYVGRVFINMDLGPEQYLQYYTNAKKDKVPKANFNNNLGTFEEAGIKAYETHIKGMNTPTTLFCSDIRAFQDKEAISFINNNNFKDYNDLLSLKIAGEVSNHKNFIRDMNLQKDWMKSINAQYGLFKFKLKTRQYTKSEAQYEYADGDIILQAWAPITSTETRLFVTPDRKDKAYYNVSKYTNQLNTFNQIMRTAELYKVKLSDLGMTVIDKPDCNIGEIWKKFLPRDKIGMDAILETYILYDYLKNNPFGIDSFVIKSSDIQMLISDITSGCKNEYENRVFPRLNITRGDIPLDDYFVERLDFNGYYDKKICTWDEENVDQRRNSSSQRGRRDQFPPRNPISHSSQSGSTSSSSSQSSQYPRDVLVSPDTSQQRRTTPSSPSRAGLRVDKWVNPSLRGSQLSSSLGSTSSSSSQSSQDPYSPEQKNWR